jgi:hypothetical protein
MKRPSSDKDDDDGTIMVTWKTLPIAIGFAGFLLLICVGTDRQREIGTELFVGTCLAILAFFLLRFFIVALKPSKHPAGEIAELLAAGEKEKAYEKGVALLDRAPNDAVTQLNCAAAMFQTGRVDEARRLFSAIRRDDLPKFLRPVYDDWEKQLRA